MKPAALGWDVIEMHCAAEASGYPMTVADIIRRFATDRRDISRHYVNNCLARYLLNGDPNKKRKKGSAQRATTKERKWIKARLTRTPDAYFTEVRTAFQKKWAWRISDRMISKALHKAGARGDKLDKRLSLKVLERVARQRNEDARNRCRAGFAGFPARCLLFFDESSVDRRTLRRRRGWAPVGEPARVRELFEVLGMTRGLHTLLAAANYNGFVLPACKVVKGGVTDDKLYEYAERHLVPIMNTFDHRQLENSIVVLDNALIHHSPRFQRLLKETGALVYFLSPCESPAST